jgi:hypothetical protein
MKRRRIVGSTFVLAFTVFATLGSGMFAGCSTDGHTEAVLKTSRANSYSSIQQLTKDADLVASVTGTSKSTVVTNEMVPSTVTSVHVDHLYKGGAPKRTIKVRQLGAAGKAVDKSVVFLQEGHHYLAFLDHFSYGSDRPPTGQWVIVGAMAGLYEQQDASYVRLDTESVRLPEKESVTTMRGEVANYAGVESSASATPSQ